MKRKVTRVVPLVMFVAVGGIVMAACEDDSTPGVDFGGDASLDTSFGSDDAPPTAVDAAGDVSNVVDTGVDAADAAADVIDIDAPFQTPDGGGPGVYVVHGASALGSSLQGTALADFDEDGKLDLVIAGIDTGNKGGAIVALGDGLGGFVYETTVTTQLGAADVVASDFDKDGHQDLLVYQTGVGSKSYVALGIGNGLFQAPTEVTLPNDGNFERLAVGDFNGDGYVDVGIPLGSGAYAALNDGAGGFADAVNLGGGGGTFAMTAADVDGDGDIDLAWNAGVGNPLHFAINGGAGTFSTSAQAITGLAALGFGDLNGDGHPDIVSAGNSNNVYRVFVIPTKANGTYLPAVEYPPGANGRPRLVDFDGDAKRDVVVARTGGLFNLDGTGVGTVYVHRGSGDGTLGAVWSYVVAGGAIIGDVVIGDVNGNGKPDIVVLDVDGKATTLLH